MALHRYLQGAIDDLVSQRQGHGQGRSRVVDLISSLGLGNEVQPQTLAVLLIDCYDNAFGQLVQILLKLGNILAPRLDQGGQLVEFNCEVRLKESTP